MEIPKTEVVYQPRRRGNDLLRCILILDSVLHLMTWISVVSLAEDRLNCLVDFSITADIMITLTKTMGAQDV